MRHDPLEQFGVVVDDRHDDRVVVWKVTPRSPAFYGGIKPGDVITRFGDQRIVHYKSFTDAVAAARPGVVAIEVARRERVRPIRVELPREYVGYNEERRRSTTDRRIDADQDDRRDVEERGEARDRVKIQSDDDSQSDAAPRRSPAPRNGENK